MNSNIQKHWVETTLGDIATHPQYGWTTKATTSGKYKYFRTTDIKDPVDWEKVPFCSELPKNPDDYVVHKNDILVSRAGSVGLSIRIKEDLPDTLFASYLIRFTPIAPIDSKIIEYFFNTKEYWSFISDSQAGIAVPNVNASKLSELPFPLPPINEQKRIVEKLDTILPKVKNAKARLENIPKILKKFRQSVLADACSGKLTEEWREGKELPEWEDKKAEEITSAITKGTTPKAHEILEKGPIPYLKVYNIVNQMIDFHHKPQYVSVQTHQIFLKRSAIYPDDVLMNIVGPPLGKIAIVTDEFKEWNINQAIAFFRPIKEAVITKYLYYVLCNGDPIKEVSKEFRGSAGQQNISLEQARNFIIPLPPIEEQQEIVRRVEKLFALADSLEEKYKTAIARVEKIEQSVLAKAFRGELVEPDPNDEPAEILLKRILDVRAKNLSPQRKTGKKKKGENGVSPLRKP